MFLSDVGLRGVLKTGDLVITPLFIKSVQPASIDLHLGGTFRRVTERKLVDPYVEQKIYTSERKDGEPFDLRPHEFILATTVETVALSNAILGQVCGKSSLARLGLVTESAGFIDPGFSGELTLELYNQNECGLRLYSGMAIAQLIIGVLDQPCAVPYAGRYQGQTGPTASRFHLP